MSGVAGLGPLIFLEVIVCGVIWSSFSFLCHFHWFKSINLSNFDPFDRSIKINSPRSLEVCFSNGIDPLSLYHKSYKEIKNSVNPLRRNDEKYIRLMSGPLDAAPPPTSRSIKPFKTLLFNRASPQEMQFTAGHKSEATSAANSKHLMSIWP